MIFGFIKRTLRLAARKKQWRRNNPHNQTRINRDFDFDLVEVGNYTYGTISISSTNSVSKVYIGHFCSIADNVLFMINNEHPVDHLSTYPFKSRICGLGGEAISKGDIVVSDDVWIGNDAKVMSGVTIGQGAVVAAGAIVTKNVPPYAIVAGIPAKVVKFRFDEETINKLLQIDYSRITEDLVRSHLDDLYKSLNESNIFQWVPKK